MDDVDRAVIGVRAGFREMVDVSVDGRGFARDVDAMRVTLEDGLGMGADRAGRGIETALARAVRTGKLGFDDLKRVALQALGEIAVEAVGGGLSAILGGVRGGGGGGLGAVLAGLVGGQPGRATGGPVTPGRAYRVGERGPELFVPTASGRVETGASAPAREVRVAITVHAGAGEAPAVLQRSSRQVARAVRAALAE